VAEVRAKLTPGTPVEVWFQDEMRVGQKNKLIYRWARKGSRPRAAHDQRTQSTYLFGAVCPEHGTALGGATNHENVCTRETRGMPVWGHTHFFSPGRRGLLFRLP
jgi:DDE superfamily endonuclease